MGWMGGTNPHNDARPHTCIGENSSSFGWGCHKRSSSERVPGEFAAFIPIWRLIDRSFGFGKVPGPRKQTPRALPDWPWNFAPSEKLREKSSYLIRQLWVGEMLWIIIMGFFNMLLIPILKPPNFVAAFAWQEPTQVTLPPENKRWSSWGTDLQPQAFSALRSLHWKVPPKQ